MTYKMLQHSFFARDTEVVAQELLGKYIVCRRHNKINRYMITEVEAYVGPHDLASHAARGKTARNEVMFGPAGHWYVYLCYGVHWMLNVVTEKEGYPAAVLIRGVREAQGPGRVTKLLGVNGAYNKQKIAPRSGLWCEDRGTPVVREQITRAPRIGIPYAKEWKDAPLRYILTPANTKGA